MRKKRGPTVGWTVQDIRQRYIEFFKEREHRAVDSWPIVPPDDPTLLFTSAGMVQFKPYYSGTVDVLFRRACSVQKCFRAGGKGSDLENVGRTIRHHTFFEMLGNFSFGDYFKREAIQWAWEFINLVGIDQMKLYVTVFEDDDEAEAIWRDEVGFPAERIFRLGAKDNFWGPAGDTGACGPSSEILYDMGPDFEGSDDPKTGIENGDERYLEFWNLVFPQFDQQKDGSRPPLKNRGIDTGMGLERLACILQGVKSPYHTNEMRPICDAAAKACGVNYNDSKEISLSLNVIADHIRAMAFVINEGILPGNEGRGYVVRRILRRAIRHGKKIGMDRPFLAGLIDVVIEQMQEAYPELNKNPAHLKKAVAAEEETFHRTLNTGVELLGKIMADLGEGGVIPGEDVFKLHDTYGFPPDLTQEIAEEKGIQADLEGYKRIRQEMAGEGAKRKAKFYQSADHAEELKGLFHEHGATQFLGYDYSQFTATAKILAIFQQGHRVASAEAGAELEIILDRTPFYAESGGQTGDIGKLTANGLEVEVRDTQKSAEGLFLHEAVVLAGSIQEGEEICASIDAPARWRTMRNHTATHLMQGALKRVLGEHVTQAGSYVCPDYLRFDFTHLAAVKPGEIEEIERIVNAEITRNNTVTTEELPIDEAKKRGAIAPFGEKYGAVVRVVQVGKKVGDERPYSIEFCGGTHVQATGQIGPFVITGESSVAAGMRRIEATAGDGAVNVILSERRKLAEVCQQLSAKIEEAPERVAAMQKEIKELRKELSKAKQQQSAGEVQDLTDKAENIGGTPVVVAQLDGLGMNELRAAMDVVKSKLPTHAAFLVTAQEGKVSMLCAVSKDLHGKLKAGDVVKQVAPLVQGGGGGRPDLAQAGGKDPNGIPVAMKAAREAFNDALLK
ncbi:alanine--tRNA ligase [Candidatus Sumerlaeota bacterium]|nr:alanine--tRNA ligase [Candidatus Sumerlaeota bacterium]